MRSHGSLEPAPNNGAPKLEKPPATSRPPSRHSAVGAGKSTAADSIKGKSVLRKRISIGILSASAPGTPGKARVAPTLPGTASTTSTSTEVTTARTTLSPTTATFSGSRARALAAAATAARTPLRPRDHNVGPSVSRQLSSSAYKAKPTVSASQATPTKMRSAANTNTAPPRQPQMPSLSAAAAKAISRASTPRTPKIATSRPQQQQQHPTVTVATPLPRRTQRPDSAASSAVGSGVNGQKDDFASPVSAFLSSNITPRSGSRQNRVDSANSTPTGTPNPDRSDAWETRSGLGISGLDGEGGDLRRLGVTFSPTPAELGRHDPDSKFFYANDARTTQQTAQLSKPLAVTQPKASNFFYANGESVAEKSNSSVLATPFIPVSGQSQENFTSKFVYANGTPDVQKSPVVLPPSAPGSTVSTTSRMAPGRTAAANQVAGYPPLRPVSPIKMASLPSLKNGSTPTLASRGQSTTAGPPGSSTTTLRRTSVDTPPRGHSRSGSLATADGPAVPRLISQQAQQLHASPHMLSHPSSETPSPINLSNPSLTSPTAVVALGLSSLLQATEDFALTPLPATADDRDTLQSPTKAPSHTSDQHLTDLVASARRERKVQDLEITNASLEAINRTLERQLRKQTAELRRYRRLSRSGRLSLASEVLGGRIASDSTVGGGALARAGMGVDDLSDDEDEDGSYGDEEVSEDDFYSDGDSDSGSGSGSGSRSSTAALRSERRRRRDEQRLRLDLSKHQQLLVDSQKMNQSLKRCLGWTEELIAEGKRALAFSVRVSEVEIGGRVLHPVDEDDVDGEEMEEGEGDEGQGSYVFEGGTSGDAEPGGDGEGSDGTGTSRSDEDEGKLDRDSAIELHGGDGG